MPHVHLRFALAVALTLTTILAGRAEEQTARTDLYGDPLPSGATVRLGTQRFRVEGYRAATLSPDGKTIATLSSRQKICVLDATTGKEIRSFNDTSAVSTLSFSPDGKYLAASSFNNALVLYDATKGNSVGQFELDKNIRGGGNTKVVFSADGKIVSVGTQGAPREKASIGVFEVATQKKLASVEPMQDFYVQVALSGDGKILATWGQSQRERPANPDLLRTIQLWDVATAKEKSQIKVTYHLPVAVALSPDGKQLATIEHFVGLTIWEVESGKEVRRIAVRQNTNTLSYSPDGKMLAAGTSDGALQAWETATGKRLGLAEGLKGPISSIAFPGGDKVLAAGVHEQSLFVLEARSGKQLSPKEVHTSAIRTVNFSRDGKTIYSAGADGLRVWETATGKSTRHLEFPEGDPKFDRGPPMPILSPDGKYVAAMSPYTRNELRMLEADTGRELFSVPLINSFGDALGSFSPDGKLFAASTRSLYAQVAEIVLRVWDVESGLEVTAIKRAQSSQQNTVAFSRDGKYLAWASANPGANPCQIVMVELASGKEVFQVQRANNFPTGLAFSPDGSRLAAVGQDGAVRLWETARGNELPPLESDDRGGTQAAALAIAPDGRTLATAFLDQKTQESRVVLWELASGKPRATYAGHRGTINSLAFSPDGRTLASGGSDTTMILWDVTGRSDTDFVAKANPTGDELTSFWNDLSNVAPGKAQRALAQLTGVPTEAVRLIQKELPPAAGKGLAAKEVEALIADLDAEEFAKREKAMRALTDAGPVVAPALQKALEAVPSVEKKRRIEQLLDTLSSGRPSPEMLRPTRALELLERLDTPEARKLLEELAKGNPGARLTSDAKATLERLNRKRD
jgi:WD40 repeat protein